MQIKKVKPLLFNKIKKAFNLTKKFHDILLDHILNYKKDFKIQSTMLFLNEALTCINSSSLIYFTNYLSALELNVLEPFFNLYFLVSISLHKLCNLTPYLA